MFLECVLDRGVPAQIHYLRCQPASMALYGGTPGTLVLKDLDRIADAKGPALQCSQRT